MILKILDYIKEELQYQITITLWTISRLNIWCFIFNHKTPLRYSCGKPHNHDLTYYVY